MTSVSLPLSRTALIAALTFLPLVMFSKPGKELSEEHHGWSILAKLSSIKMSRKCFIARTRGHNTFDYCLLPCGNGALKSLGTGDKDIYEPKLARTDF